MKENRNIMRKENNENIGIGIVQFIFGLILLVMILFSFIGCSSLKEIPIETIEKVVVKDSVVFVTDSVYVEIPKEVIKEILPTDTTSILSTSVARSEAKVEKGILTHRLEQKGTIPVRIDTHYVTKIKEVEKMVEVPVEVEVIKYKRDGLFWFSIIFNIITILLFAFRLYLKTKGLK